ncbi:MAG: class I SAM-dependent methyltransferase, partial [Candidatus Rokuibacteriota bacterium]
RRDGRRAMPPPPAPACSLMTPVLPFPPGAFRRANEEDDRHFYALPRPVVHLDQAALAALAGLYEALLPAHGLVLDLMASWRSHMPDTFAGTLIGLGMSAAEMRDNPRLAQALVHDLNREPRLPFADDAFDAVVCAVSVQYLTRPAEVFAEVRRTLRAGAPLVVSFGDRCFPEKAVALWHAATSEQHVAIVAAYFAAGGFPEVFERRHAPAGDPLYVVWSFKPS